MFGNNNQEHETTTHHFRIARGRVGHTSPGCGADLRREGQRSRSLYRNHRSRGRSILTYVGYDLGSSTRRYDGRAFGIGVSYGYSWMLSTRWNVAVEAGIGLFRTRDTRRDPTVGDWDDEYIWHYRRWTLFPSKLGVSFSYLF